MAQNLVISGVQYNDVPKIEAPTADGGTAEFVDTSDGTIWSEDSIEQGKIAYSGGYRIVGTGGGKPFELWSDEEVLDKLTSDNVGRFYKGFYGSEYLEEDKTYQIIELEGSLVYKECVLTGNPIKPFKGLRFTSYQNGSTISLNTQGSFGTHPLPTFETSVDRGDTWQSYTLGTSITLNNGDTIYFRGTNTTLAYSNLVYTKFSISGIVGADGSIMSLLDGVGESTIITQNYCFCKLFDSCDGLYYPPKLPATTLAMYCYLYMFINCENLQPAAGQNVVLPATTLVDKCYVGMFCGCKHMINGPEIHATQLAWECFESMFYYCSDLQEVKLHYTGNFDFLYFRNWMRKVPVYRYGVLYYNGTDTTRGESAIPESWDVETF